MKQEIFIFTAIFVVNDTIFVEYQESKLFYDSNEVSYRH